MPGIAAGRQMKQGKKGKRQRVKPVILLLHAVSFYRTKTRPHGTCTEVCYTMAPHSLGSNILELVTELRPRTVML